MDRGLTHRRCIRVGRPTGTPMLAPADQAHCHTLDPVTQRRPAPRICTSPRPPPRPPAPMWPSTMFMGAMITGGMAPPAPGIISLGTSMPGPPGPMTMPWSKTIWPPSGPCRPPPRGLDTRGGPRQSRRRALALCLVTRTSGLKRAVCFLYQMVGGYPLLLRRNPSTPSPTPNTLHSVPRTCPSLGPLGAPSVGRRPGLPPAAASPPA